MRNDFIGYGLTMCITHLQDRSDLSSDSLRFERCIHPMHLRKTTGASLICMITTYMTEKRETSGNGLASALYKSLSLEQDWGGSGHLLHIILGHRILSNHT